MRTYDLKLEGRDEIAAGTMAFHVTKPADFAFKPGQAIDLILPAVPTADPASGRHAFSIVSAPFESRLTIATRMRDSPYKRALGTLAIGSPIQVEGPFGSLTLHNDRARPAVLVAGGIGITPFMSILRQTAHDQLPHALILLYANRRPEDTAFLAELQTLAEQNRHFRLLATMTQMSKSSLPWSGRSGAIDEALLRPVAGDFRTAIYYLAGPPAMVEALHQLLSRIGVDDDDIRSEEFYGY